MTKNTTASSSTAEFQPLKKEPVPPATLFITRLGVVVVLTILAWGTIFYCSRVYYDQNAALQELLGCAQGQLEKANLTFWLDGGTLLGQMRHQRFVVWDGDVTLGALSNATGGLYDSMVDLAERCKLHFTPVLPTGADDEAVGWYLYNSQVGLRVLEWIPSISSPQDFISHGANLVHKMQTMFPLRPCGIHSMSSSCPNNGSAVLDSRFGDAWHNTTLMSLF